jgi:hypothetical protein
MGYLGVDFTSIGLSATSTGVRTDLYYGSYYDLSLLWLFPSQNILGIDVLLGAGGFIHLNKIGYRDGVEEDIEEKMNFQVGPSGRVFLLFGDLIFLGLENNWGIWGLQRQLVKFPFVPAHMTRFVFGVRF